MNKFRFLLLIFAFITVDAQELDQNFLESLPDDVKEDLLDRADENQQNSQENYRSSIYSSKLERAEELLELKNRLELDLMELDRRLKSDEKLSISLDLKLFGSDFFRTFQTSYMPVNEPNLDSSYTLDVGDSLNIQIIGQKDILEQYSVNRDGSIFIPDIGKLIISGLTLSEASDLIKSKVSSVFIGTDAYISLDQIRDVNVLVSGNVLPE